MNVFSKQLIKKKGQVCYTCKTPMKRHKYLDFDCYSQKRSTTTKLRVNQFSGGELLRSEGLKILKQAET